MTDLMGLAGIINNSGGEKTENRNLQFGKNSFCAIQLPRFFKWLNTFTILVAGHVLLLNAASRGLKAWESPPISIHTEIHVEQTNLKQNTGKHQIFKRVRNTVQILTTCPQAYFVTTSCTNLSFNACRVLINVYISGRLCNLVITKQNLA